MIVGMESSPSTSSSDHSNSGSSNGGDSSGSGSPTVVMLPSSTESSPQQAEAKTIVGPTIPVIVAPPGQAEPTSSAQAAGVRVIAAGVVAVVGAALLL